MSESPTPAVSSDSAALTDLAADPAAAVPSALDAPSTPGVAAGSPTVDEVMEALGNVIDPELGLDFVELGLIYGVEVDDGNVNVTFTLTTPGCPIGPQVTEQIEEFVGELEGVRSIESEMVFTPPWSPELMTEDAKFALGY
jgi:metal-sulfur cluster biosynthetic enzyme